MKSSNAKVKGSPFWKTMSKKTKMKKMRTRAFKEQMDKEEIVHLKKEIGQLREIFEAFNHKESQSHLISKRQSSVKNPNVTPLTCSISGNCVILGKFCPYPDKPATPTNNSSTIGIDRLLIMI